MRLLTCALHKQVSRPLDFVDLRVEPAKSQFWLPVKSDEKHEGCEQRNYGNYTNSLEVTSLQHRERDDAGGELSLVELLHRDLVRREKGFRVSVAVVDSALLQCV